MTKRFIPDHANNWAPGGSVVKNSPAKQETWVRSLGQEDPLKKEMATLLQYSCLGNPMERGAWCAIVYGVAKELDVTQRLSNNNILIINIQFKWSNHSNYKVEIVRVYKKARSNSMYNSLPKMNLKYKDRIKAKG